MEMLVSLCLVCFSQKRKYSTCHVVAKIFFFNIQFADNGEILVASGLPKKRALEVHPSTAAF